MTSPASPAPPHPLLGWVKALLAAALIQFGTVVWWASSLTTRVNQVEDTIGEIILLRAEIAALKVDLASIRTSMTYMAQRLDRIEQRANLTFLAPEDRP